MRYTILKLTPEVKEFLTKISFPEIPAEAEVCIFDRETGDAQFVERFEGPAPELKIIVMSYYETDEVVVE
jgi:hypothetical protein